MRFYLSRSTAYFPLEKELIVLDFIRKSAHHPSRYRGKERLPSAAPSVTKEFARCRRGPSPAPPAGNQSPFSRSQGSGCAPAQLVKEIWAKRVPGPIPA